MDTFYRESAPSPTLAALKQEFPLSDHGEPEALFPSWVLELEEELCPSAFPEINTEDLPLDDDLYSTPSPQSMSCHYLEGNYPSCSLADEGFLPRSAVHVCLDTVQTGNQECLLLDDKPVALFPSWAIGMENELSPTPSPQYIDDDRRSPASPPMTMTVCTSSMTSPHLEEDQPGYSLTEEEFLSTSGADLSADTYDLAMSTVFLAMPDGRVPGRAQPVTESTIEAEEYPYLQPLLVPPMVSR